MVALRIIYVCPKMTIYPYLSSIDHLIIWITSLIISQGQVTQVRPCMLY